MNLLMAGLMLASAETVRAENKILKTLVVAPRERVQGPLVSVIIPAYNEERYLPGLLQALRNQTYETIEVTVVDNVSDDQTIAVAREWGANVIINYEPANIAKSRNMGAKVSHGNILVFIDADTIPESIAIESVVRSMTENGSVMVQLNRCCSDSHVQSLLRVIGGWLPTPLVSSTFNGQFTAVTREAYEAVGGYDETLLPLEGFGEDVDFIEKIVSLYPDNITYLRTIYTATSGRRQKAEGYIVPQHFQERAIRRLSNVIQLKHEQVSD